MEVASARRPRPLQEPPHPDQAGRQADLLQRGLGAPGGRALGHLRGLEGRRRQHAGLQMLFDQMFVIEGALRHCEFDVVPGTITCATRPAAVSGSPAVDLLQSIGLGGLVISKMLAHLQRRGAAHRGAELHGRALFPINPSGRRPARRAVQLVPARPGRRRPVRHSTGATARTPAAGPGTWPSTMPNVEETELFYPMLFLWRREVPDSGGAGRWRGGNGAELAFVPHTHRRHQLVTWPPRSPCPARGCSAATRLHQQFAARHDAGSADQIARTGRMPDRPGRAGRRVDMVPAEELRQGGPRRGLWVFGWAGVAATATRSSASRRRWLEDVVDGRVGRGVGGRRPTESCSRATTSGRVDQAATGAAAPRSSPSASPRGAPWTGDGAAQVGAGARRTGA